MFVWYLFSPKEWKRKDFTEGPSIRNCQNSFPFLKIFGVCIVAKQKIDIYLWPLKILILGRSDSLPVNSMDMDETLVIHKIWLKSVNHSNFYGLFHFALLISTLLRPMSTWSILPSDCIWVQNKLSDWLQSKNLKSTQHWVIDLTRMRSERTSVRQTKVER